jgi:fused signal recognition particle receptor
VRLRGRLARSRSGFGQGLLGLLGAGELDEESWEDVEAMLLQADLGPEMTAELVERLRTELAARAVRTPSRPARCCGGAHRRPAPDLERAVRALPHDGRPAVLLVVGRQRHRQDHHHRQAGRGCWSRAARTSCSAPPTPSAPRPAEQLGTWGRARRAHRRARADGADPASVAFDAVKQGAEEGADVVLLDTAGACTPRPA